MKYEFVYLSQWYRRVAVLGVRLIFGIPNLKFSLKRNTHWGQYENIPPVWLEFVN